MSNNQYTATSVRKLVDKFFSLQWCRDNLVVPLYEETSLPMSNGIIKIAIANYSYLGTIASPIKDRLSQSGFKCEFLRIFLKKFLFFRQKNRLNKKKVSQFRAKILLNMENFVYFCVICCLIRALRGHQYYIQQVFIFSIQGG